MLKYLAEMSYRPKDLVHRALKDYIAGKRCCMTSF